MIIGTAGHIDHGKTTLVKALTGVDCDRLKEEKARGITVDLGYAYTEKLGFIDVPGHEKLIHNMLAGATGIDFALLVIAADDGPMPQTREHLEIVELLGIQRGAVALTKIDVATVNRKNEAKTEIAELLAGTALADATIFPVAAVSGEGIAELRAHLEAAAAEQGERQAAGGFRLAIDRCFTLSGAGTVVTGTAFAGSVKVGDQLILTPPDKPVRVRSLRVQDAPAESGHAGQRIALALSGVEKAEVDRGQWIVASGLHAPVRRFDARIRVLSGQPALKHWTQVHLHLGAEDVPARIGLLGADEIAPGCENWAQIAVDREIGALAGDRFILRDAAARHTIGGGIVLDIFPPSRKKSSPERLAMLAALADTDLATALQLAAEQQPAGVDLATHALNRNLDAATLAALCQQLNLKVVGATAFAPSRWQELEARLLAAIAAEHERAPDLTGVERDRLRRLTLPTLSRPAFDALLATPLADGRIAQTNAWLHLPEHRVQLAAADRELWQTLKPLLAADPYAPPRVRDIAKASGVGEDSVRTLFKRIARHGDAWPVAHDHFFTAEAVAELARQVAALNQRDGCARAASLRDEIGGGRKVAIHILEFFDRIGYTRRVRDTHVLRGIPEQFG
ncbi:MAG: selenocysteine-specific translation elongation factor [Gammaproteobacteria bacterium]|nr:selenocysteine-specific translation elongation factor [Gammaproteobacteria bacterium]MBU1600468.1 selenocysteine-specific translation elongation factor [Gammaproteobacteria bacterium]MBU2434924.1 selenocysteine-specific translation elongation factor [Gammaproteobacteria bacterium]MBU2448160.1 selenocysteine-specific translation elongation factor [Gammaproteobacteria bacterium]